MAASRLNSRATITSRLSSWLHNPADDNIAILLGTAGSGRSTVLRAFAEKEELSTIWIASRGRSDDGPYEGLLRILKMRPSYATVDSGRLAAALVEYRHLNAEEIAPIAFDTITENRRPEDRLLVVLSGAETLDPQSRELLWLIAPHVRPQGASIIATGLPHSAPVFTYGDPIIVPPLELEECYDEIVRATDVFPPSTVVRRLRHATGGNPRALLSIVSRLSAQQIEGTELLPHPLEMERSDAQHVLSGGAIHPGVGGVEPQILRALAMFALHNDLRGRHPLPGVSEEFLARLYEEGWLLPTAAHSAPTEPAQALAAWNLLSAKERVQLHQAFSVDTVGLNPDYLAFHRLHASHTMTADEACTIACGLFDSGAHVLAQSATRALEAVHAVPPVLAHRLIAHGLVQPALRAATGYSESDENENVDRSIWRSVRAELVFLGLASPLPVRSPFDDMESSDAVVAMARALLFADSPEVARQVTAHYRERQGTSGADADIPLALLEAELALYDHADDAPTRMRTVLTQRKPGVNARETFTDVLHLMTLGRLADAAVLLSEAETHVAASPPQSLALQGLARSSLAVARGRHREAPTPLAAFTLTMPMVGFGSSIATAVLLRLRATLGRNDRFSRQLARVRRVDQRSVASSSRSEILAATGFAELLLHRTSSAAQHLRQALLTGGTLLQGRLDVIADLLESLVAAGRSTEEVADVYRHHSVWLPDHVGDRSEILRARCELLASPPDRIHAAYQASLGTFSDHFAYEHARTQLAYGRLVQRHESPNEAVEIIREASTVFQSLGLDGFVESAQKVATALSPRQEAHLSAVEQEVLILVKQGHTNQQIATRLFASKRTIESHLTRIFRALNVSTKRELLQAT